ncbi:PLP-dependent aminotransferase family protein [Streptomyces sp. ODS28]|uniref:MocR-like pyridoxine biosynthesis transcription factor PdxR n=1 Tax=Streptomyces sp. ODS28 TaxID=3136688 RepID=UPI0031E7F07B
MDRSNEEPSEGSKEGPGEGSGSDFLQLRASDAPPGGLSDWLAGELRRALADGRLRVGARLPATRVLAAELRVSRGAVTEAYRRLAEDGLVAGERRRGTRVVAVPLTASAPPARGPGPAASPFRGPPGPDAFDALRAAPARFDLTPGVPDLAAFPHAAWLRAERAVLSELPPHALGYGDPRGAPALRAAVSRWLARTRGVLADPDGVLIVAGTTQAIALLARVLPDEGVRGIAVEDPGSLGFRQHLRYWGFDTPPVPVDASGLRVDALRRTGAPAVVLTPAHQFPTGAVLGGERRRELMRWADGEGGLIVEDDYDAEHRYDRPPVPALKSVLAERVCYVGSISKLLAPALRIGWILAPPRYRDALVEAKRYADLGNAVLPQLVLARLLDSGELERGLRLVRRRHRACRDAMTRALAEHLPYAVVQGAAAGLHLTVTIGDAPGQGEADGARADGGRPGDRALADAALARGVKVHPLSWHRQTPGPPGLVLGYAANGARAIGDGVAELGRAARDFPGTRDPARRPPNVFPVSEDLVEGQ